MFIGRQLKLIVASVAFLGAVAGCSGAESDALEPSDGPEATEAVEANADELASDEAAAEGDVEKGGEFTQCFGSSQACEQQRQFLENNNNDCGSCVANGCGTGVFSLTCSPEE